MSYRFECGLCSSVASAQLQFRPKKTQDRLIRLLVIVRLKWSEQGRMFLNQMRELRQKGKKRPKKHTPPKENQLFYTTSYLSLCADAEFTTTVPQFPGRATERKVMQVKITHVSHNPEHVMDRERFWFFKFCCSNNFNVKGIVV